MSSNTLRLSLPVTTVLGISAALMASGLASLPSQILPLVLGAMTDELGLDAVRTSWLASADLVGISCAAVTGYFWVPRLDLYRVVVVGLVLFVAGNVGVLLLLAADSGFWLVYAVRLIGGLGAGLVNTAAMATLARHPNPERAFSLNLTVVVLLASTSYTALPSWIKAGGLPAAFMLLIGLGIVTWLFCLRYFPTTSVRPMEHEPASDTPAAPPPLPLVSTVVVCMAAYLSSASMMMLWAYTERIGVSSGLDLVTVGNIMAFGFLLSSVTCFIASWQGNKLGRKLPLLISALGMTVALLLMGAPQGTWFWVSFAFGVFMFSSMWNYSIPFKTALAATLDPHGRTIALFVALGSIAGATGPMLGGFIASDGNYQRVIVYTGVIFVVAIVSFVLLDAARSVRKPRPAEAAKLAAAS